MLVRNAVKLIEKPRTSQFFSSAIYKVSQLANDRPHDARSVFMINTDQQHEASLPELSQNLKKLGIFSKVVDKNLYVVQDGVSFGNLLHEYVNALPDVKKASY